VTRPRRGSHGRAGIPVGVRTKFAHDGEIVTIVELFPAGAITCERCGEPGVLQRTRYWAKTLCTCCADALGYAPVPPDMA